MVYLICAPIPKSGLFSNDIARDTCYIRPRGPTKSPTKQDKPHPRCSAGEQPIFPCLSFEISSVSRTSQIASLYNILTGLKIRIHFLNLGICFIHPLFPLVGN